LSGLLDLEGAQFLLKTVHTPTDHHHHTHTNDTIHTDRQRHTDTVNQVFYLDVLKCLRDGVQRKQPEKCNFSLWMLHHVNTLTGSICALHKGILDQAYIPLLPHPNASLK